MLSFYLLSAEQYGAVVNVMLPTISEQHAFLTRLEQDEI